MMTGYMGPVVTVGYKLMYAGYTLVTVGYMVVTCYVLVDCRLRSGDREFHGRDFSLSDTVTVGYVEVAVGHMAAM